MASFRDLISYYRGYGGAAIFGIGAASAFEIMDLVVPYAIGQILNALSGRPLDRFLQEFIDRWAVFLQVPANTSLSLGVLLGIIFVVAVVRAPIQPWVGSWFHWAVPLRARRDRSEQVLAKILSLPLEFYDENNPGRIAGRVARGLSNHLWTFPEVAGQLIPKLARVLGIFAIIWFIEWRIAIAFILSFAIILAFSLRKLKWILKREQALDRYIENTESRTSEMITNIKTVKAFAAEAQELHRQRQRLDRELYVVLYRIHKNYVKLGTWQRTTVQACLFGILTLTAVETAQGKISLGHFVTTFTIASMAYSELEPISIVAEFFARRYASMLRLHEFLELPSGKDVASLDLEPVTANPYRFTGKVQFENLSFGYNPERLVLEDVSLTIAPCQTVALVGRSGSGKSTLVKLLFRYFSPHSGRILIDGEDIQTLEVARYRRRLAIVHQEVDIFNGTLLDNLKYGNPEASQADVDEACRIARVDEFLHELPDGFYTVVGERGVRLSGGQRQRLGIARALIVDPDVLIFDEATSSLDYESERLIQLAMQSLFGTRTTIVIAHRLSTVRQADKIVVLDRGRIAEVGSHEELLNHGGIYQRLHSLQAEGELV